MTISLIHPVNMALVVETQSFDEHVEYAERHGYCSKPGRNCNGKYYYGGIDYAPKNTGGDTWPI